MVHTPRLALTRPKNERQTENTYMKKPLPLLALTTALMATTSAYETGTYWVQGVWNQETQKADGWFDAEKDTKGGTGNRADGELCWAASSSNLIAWWQKQQDYVPERTPPTELNDIWNQYRDTWLNVGGHTELGIHWWLDGSYEDRLMRPNGHPENGGYYAGSLSYPRVERADLQKIEASSFKNDVHSMSEALVGYITSGYGVELTWAVPDWDNDGYTNGHSVTLWGVDYNDTLGRIINFYITDSDDYQLNTLTKVQVNVGTDIEGTTTLTRTKNGGVYTAYSFTVLNSRLGNDIHYFNTLDTATNNIILKQAVDDEGFKLTSDIQEVKDIVFDGSRGTQSRLLTVEGEHTAEKLCMNGSGTNTINVTEGSKLTVDQISGGQKLTKAGAGALEIQGGAAPGGLHILDGDVVNNGSLGEVTMSGGYLVNGGTTGDITINEGGTAEMVRTGANKDGKAFTLCKIEDGGVLKGSGSFGKVVLDHGGTLVVGNSPGLQTYADELIINGGKLVFSIDDALRGWQDAASATVNGWGSGTYSVIDMLNAGLTFNPDEIVFALGKTILERSANVKDLADAVDTTFSITLSRVAFVDGLNMMSDLLKYGNESVLDQLAQRTTFILSEEEETLLTEGITGAVTPSRIRYYTSGNTLYMEAGLNVMLAKAANDNVPEPATGTLSLLALAGLCARRRRK